MKRRRAAPSVRRAASIERHAFLAPHEGAASEAGARRDAEAGRLVLALVDRQRPPARRETWPTRRDIRDARRIVADMDYAAGIRGALEGVLDALAEACTGRVPFAAGTLFTYARALLNDARWGQAAAVFQAYIGRAATMTDFARVPEAYLRLAYTLRAQGKLDGALAACRMGEAVAVSLGDVATGLRLRISEANVAKYRGNLLEADAVLAEVAAAAERHGLVVVRAYAVHDRGVIAYESGRLRDAVPQIYEAWLAYTEPQAKDRALGDLALALADLGLRDAARDALLVISETASEREMRLAARINLMELASRDGQETAFEQYRQELAVQKMTVRMEAYFHYTVGEGYKRFDRPDSATAAYARAEEVASRNQVHQMAFRAEAAQRELALTHVAPPREGVEELAHVVMALKAARARAP